MTDRQPTALIAEDEPLLRDSLERQLRQAWPELGAVALARNGREAVELFEARHPEVCFLDVHMPGMTGIEAARHIGRRAYVVFVTAYDQYAVQAFAEGVLDYLVKPVDASRLADTVARLRQRIREAQPARVTEALLVQLATQLGHAPVAAHLRWIKASIGPTLLLIPVNDVDYLRSEEKYTIVAWRGDDGAARDAIIRTSLRELVAQLDPAQFVQVHRSFAVNLAAIARVVRGPNDAAELHLKGRGELLPVSRSHLHHFRQM